MTPAGSTTTSDSSANGALASWAVPKGIPLEPGTRALAVHVEDHPLEYATFEGEIPKGEYGAGSVEIWDRGTYELVEEKKDGGLTVHLHGDRLEGTWTLVPAHLDGKEQNWLILRKRDAEGSPRRQRTYAPTSATLVDEVPRGADWLFEVKWDGYRALAYVAGSDVVLKSRRGNDFTEKFERVAKEITKAIKTPDCVIDGEVCALDEDGRASFSEMQQLKPSTPLVYYVFDLLEVDGRVARRPSDRRAARTAGGAARPQEPDRPAVRVLRRRRGAARGRRRAGARGDRRQAQSAPAMRSGSAPGSG